MKVEELIKKYCPNGVEKVKLGDIAQQEKERNRKHITENAYSITQSGLVPTKEFFKEKTRVTSEDTSGYIIVKHNWFVYSPSRVDVGSINYLKDDGPVIVSPIDVVFSVNEDKVLPQFLFEYLLSHNGKMDMLSYREGVEGTGRRSLPFKEISKMQIPLPPLPIQEEIVAILDKFTAIQENLDEELKLRQKQYEYYREKLLSPPTPEGGELQKVSQFAELKAGKAIKASELSDYIDDEHSYPCYGGNGIRGYISRHSNCGNFPIIGRQGALCGCVNWASGDFYATEHAVVVTPLNGNLSKYLYYLFDFANLNQYKSQGAQPGLAVSNLNELKYRIPTPTRQHQIVSILDKFEAMIANIKEEQKLRQKQYEYYREKLLTFN